MRLLLLNRFGPDSGAPTGRLLGELANHLQAGGHEVSLLTADSVYGGTRKGWLRWLQEFRAHGILLWKSLLHPPVDAVLSLTSPVCLLLTADLAARRHRARSYHWAMDLYPDLATGLRQLPAAAARPLRALMRRAYARAAAVVALDGDMRAHLRAVYGREAAVIAPWPPPLSWPVPPAGAEGASTWLYSGNLGQAHEVGVLLHVQQLLEKEAVPATLILQGSGAQWGESQATARALGLTRVVWRPPVPEAELTASLLGAGVLIVTRKPETKGLLWPSKLALALLSGKPILWIGDTEGATAQALRADGHGVFAPGQIDEIAAWVRLKFTSSVPLSAPQPVEPVRNAALRQWDELLAANE